MNIPICKIESCDEPVRAKGFCKLHYQKDYYYKHAEKIKADQVKRAREQRQSTRDQSTRKKELPVKSAIPAEPKKRTFKVADIQRMTPEKIIKNWSRIRL